MTEDLDLTTAAIDPQGDGFQLLRRALGVSAFGLNALVFAPGARGRIHAHEHQEEVYVVLQGELTLLVEGAERRFRPWELVRVPAAVRRQITNAGDERLVLLAIGGTGGHTHPGRDGKAWAAWDEPGDGRPPQEIPMPDTRR